MTSAWLDFTVQVSGLRLIKFVSRAKVSLLLALNFQDARLMSLVKGREPGDEVILLVRA
jgi:hypothetical protein